MSEEVENATGEGLDRRSVLKKAAIAAGTAAFATPVVAGVFSSRVSADHQPGHGDACDPALDSDAIDVLEGGERKWNINCDTKNTLAGRWNAQRSTFEIPGTTETVTIVFGTEGTDNFPVECAWYVIDTPEGWNCSTSWKMELANGNAGCVGGNKQAFVSNVIGDCAPPHGDIAAPPAGALPLPYCRDVGGKPNECVSNIFLVLDEFVCCPA